MKRLRFNILTIGVAAAGLCMTSCSESFLDVESKTESTTGNFYKTENDAWRALLGCYDGWRQISSNPGINFYVASTIMGDECYAGVGNGDARNYQVIDRFDQSESPSDLSIFEADWEAYYAAIYRCNELIDHEEQIAWAEGSDKRGLYIGEARCLRALCYFDMVRLWENIPLFLEAVNENRPQANPDEVYAAIFDDLRFAIDNIPATAYPKADAANNDGHATKYAAEAIFARAYLFYTGYYGHEPEGVTKAEALAACEDVISNSGCSLVDDYKSLWAASSLVPNADLTGWDPELSTYAGEANSEVILQMKFTPTQDYNGNNDSNRWQVMMGMRSLNYAPYGKGWGACTVCPSFLEKYEAGDLRQSASIIDLAGEGIENVADWETSWKDWREYTGYTVKKYSPLSFDGVNSASKEDGSGDFQITNPQNWVIVRLADVMLMAAELGSPNASTYMHMIRSRAGLGDVPVTQESIMNERALELAFEGHRYWDLLRQGVGVAAEAIAATAGQVTSGGNPETVSYSADKIIATRGLCQIPNNQITLASGTLVQNAGWK